MTDFVNNGQIGEPLIVAIATAPNRDDVLVDRESVRPVACPKWLYVHGALSFRFTALKNSGRMFDEIINHSEPSSSRGSI